jgi:hypothetical protein
MSPFWEARSASLHMAARWYGNRTRNTRQSTSYQRVSTRFAERGEPPLASYSSEHFLSTQPQISGSMAPTHVSWSQSDDNLPSSIPQDSDNVTDWVSRRAANGTGWEGGSPYSSSTSRRGYGSAVELREHGAGANSAADSGQPSWGRGPPPTSRRLAAPQAKAVKSFQPAAYAAEPFVPRRADLVRALLSFNPRTCDSNFRPQPHKGANGAHNPAAPSLSTAKSSDQLAPNRGLHTTQHAGGPMKSSRSTLSNEEPHTATSLPTSRVASKPSRTMPLNTLPHATAAPPTSKNTAKARVANDHASDKPPQEKSRPPEAEVGPPRATNSGKPEFQGVDLQGLFQVPATQDDGPPPPPKDPAISGRPSPSPAPRMTTAYSRRTKEPAAGEPQAPHGRHVPPDASSLPNESRGTAHPDMMGSHDPLNRRTAPNNVSSPPVRHSTAK